MRLQVKTGLAFLPSALTKDPGKKAGVREWGLFLLLAAAVSMIALFLGIMADSTYTNLEMFSAGQGHVMLTMFLVVAVILTLVFGVFYILSSFFYANDLPLLVPLPLRPAHIIISKFIVVLVNQWVTLAPVLAPALIVYGMRAPVSSDYWVKAPMVLVLTPLPVLAVASLFSILLMRLVGRSRQRDWLVVGGTLLGITIGIGSQIVSGTIMEGMDPEQLQALADGLAAGVAKYMPPALWSTEALRAGAPAAGMGYMALNAGLAAASVAVLWLVAERVFFRGLQASWGAPSVKKRRPRREGAPAGRWARRASAMAEPRPAFASLLWREWAIIWRTPIFALNTLLAMVLLPVFGTVPLLIGGSPPPEMLELIAELAMDPAAKNVGAGIGIGVVAGFALFSNIGSTAISREGRQIWVSKTIPVPPALQLISKVAFGAAASFVGAAPVGIALGVILKFGLGQWLLWAAGGAGAAAAVNAVALHIDMWRPKLDWTDPQLAIKQNFNVIISMLGAAAVTILGGFVGFMLFSAGPAAVPVGVALYFIAAAALAVAGLYYRADAAYRSFGG